MGDHGNQTCYSFEGRGYTENTKCPNSDSCCRTASQCRPNRLCSSNENSSILVRATCINRPWTLSTCAQICLYDNDTGFLPRVNICPDGSYCCDNDPTCCVDKRGFFLNNNGVITGRANQTSSSTQSTTLGTSTSARTTATSTSEPSIVPSNIPGGLSTGAKAGIGVSVSLGIIFLAFCLAFWFFRRRPRSTPILDYAQTENKPEDVVEAPETSDQPSELPDQPLVELVGDGGTGTGDGLRPGQYVLYS